MNVKSALQLNLSCKSLWKVYRGIKKILPCLIVRKQAILQLVFFYKKPTVFNEQMTILLEKTLLPDFKKNLELF